MSVVAEIVITQDDQGIVNVKGTGALINQTAYAYGLLELAKDIIRKGTDKARVQGVALHEMPRQ